MVLGQQQEGTTALAAAGEQPKYLIRNLTFDESAFDLAAERGAPSISHSVLCFYGQWTYWSELMLSMTCIQHHTGNIIEQLTKFLGVLGGIFCISKIVSKGNILSNLRKHIAYALERKLVIHSEAPPAVA